MLISISQLREIYDFKKLTDTELENRLKALEKKIRAVTHNNFQNRAVRFRSSVEGGKIIDGCPYLSAGDTIQISECGVNNGVYELLSVNDVISVSGRLYDCPHILVTKVEYHEDVVDGCIGLLKYDEERRDKVGIQSETISRHSVTYFDVSAGNQFAGYPAALTAFLRPYMKARF